VPKIPRDVSGRDLCRLLGRYEYVITRQAGSHIRLASKYMQHEHSITIPDHETIKIGTLSKILADVAGYLKIEKSDLVDVLF
jgi:predicted RNA binding protein YcfA (HicA-like mRNA interferase family)